MSRPRLLMVARGRYRFPLPEPLQRKFDALSEQFDLRVLGNAAADGTQADPRFALAEPKAVLDGAVFLARLPARVAGEIRRFRPDAVIVQGAHETAAVLLGRRLARSRVPVVLDLHGDWRAAARLYGAPLRWLTGPVADALAVSAVRRADAIRTLSPFTTGLVGTFGRQPAGVFPAYVDLASFLETPPAPLPDEPSLLFVGVLERYKNVARLCAAWRQAARRVPNARLRLIGRGRAAPRVQRLVADLPAQTSWTPHVPQPEVAAALDASWALALPSRSEGLPRIAIEAFCRGRGVVGSRSGGIPDIVEDGFNGLLADARDTDAIADAFVQVLSDRALAERFGDAARVSAEPWIAGPEEFARRTRELVDRVTGAS
jgi:glycosyltransferase involved in cell wall biosynthesis